MIAIDHKAAFNQPQGQLEYLATHSKDPMAYTFGTRESVIFIGTTSVTNTLQVRQNLLCITGKEMPEFRGESWRASTLAIQCVSALCFYDVSLSFCAHLSV